MLSRKSRTKLLLTSAPSRTACPTRAWALPRRSPPHSGTLPNFNISGPGWTGLRFAVGAQGLFGAHAQLQQLAQPGVAARPLAVLEERHVKLAHVLVQRHGACLPTHAQ